MRTIDADALCEEFKRRQRAALRWKEKAILADNEESKIRADAVLAFLSEVKLTIDNASTVELTEEQAIDKLHETGWMQNHDREMTEQPTGEWAKWIISEIRCPNCLEYFDPEWHSAEELKKCPNCGADMRKGGEGE